ncbi:MAG TPA: class I SAM-dependent methyltransferase [Thermoanaerobaculia bacterium]
MTDYLSKPIGWLHPRFGEDAYDELSFWGSRFGALMLDNLELRTGVRGLDVACGTGFPLFELAEMHGPSSHFTGVDVWPEALARARRKLAVYGLTNVELVEADAASMPFDDATFDLITSNLGINNFADPPAAMRECFRVAKPCARLSLTTNLTGHMAELYDLFRASVPAELVEQVNAQEAHRGTRADIERLLAEGGFHVTRVIESEFHLRFADGSAMFRHHLVNFFMWGWRGVTGDPAIYAAMEAELNRRAPLKMRIPMLLMEGVKQR